MYFARSGSPGRRTASAYSPGSARMWIGMARGLYRHQQGLRHADDDRADPGADVRVLRARARRARLPRGRRAARRSAASWRSCDDDGPLTALCHLGANLVPSGEGCAVFAAAAGRARSARMIIGEERAVGELWAAARTAAAGAARGSSGAAGLRDHRAAGAAGESGLRAARLDDLERARSRRAQPRTARSSASTRWRTTPKASAGARAPRSTSGARGSGSRTTSSCSRPRSRRGRPTAVQVAAGLGRPGGARPRLRRAGDARPLPPAARDDADGDALRPHRERAGDRPLRVDRHAARRPLPLHPLLREAGVLARHGESVFSVRER